MKLSTHNQKAFSQIEILVAIVLIAVLSVVIFPMAQRGREKAQQMRCMANLRQVGVDVRLYLGENRGRLPWLEQPFVTTRWWYRLYSENDFEAFEKRLICPSDTDPYRLGYKPPSQKSLRCSYLFNKQFGFSEADGTEKLGGVNRNLLTVTNASRLRMVADAPAAPAGGRQHGTADSMGFNDFSEVFRNGREAMHAGGARAHILFLDGHVELLDQKGFDQTDGSPNF